jgi:hypothetical protein
MLLTSVIFSLTRATGSDEEWVAEMFANLAKKTERQRKTERTGMYISPSLPPVESDLPFVGR